MSEIQNVENEVREHKGAAAVFVGVVLLVSGVLAGRCSAPRATVKTVDHVVYRDSETSKTNQVADAKVDVKQDDRKNEQKDVVWTRRTVKAPDGTVTVIERREDKSKAQEVASTQAEAVSKVETQVVTTKTVVQTVDHYQTVVQTYRPDWAFSARAGVNAPALLGASTPPSYVPGLPGSVVVGLDAERRLFGGLYAGVWVDSRLDAGVSLRVTW